MMSFEWLGLGVPDPADAHPFDITEFTFEKSTTDSLKVRVCGNVRERVGEEESERDV